MNIFELNADIQAALNGKPTVWLGTQESFDAVVYAQQQVAALTPEKMAQMQSRVTARDENGFPMLWEKRGASAVINISGSLVDGEAGWGRFFGVVGYDDIGKAAIDAYSDPDVKSVLWRIESPGGQVSGVMDAGSLITKLSSMKPSAAYTGNVMASGGYWLGSSVQGGIQAGPTAEVGSIGVLMVLTDVTEALKQMGIKKTIMRAGEDKARVNPFEELTKQAKDDLQAQMDDVHAIFRSQVAAARPDLTEEKLMAATTGKTFLGKRAKTAGLVDKIMSFEQALNLLDTKNPKGNTPSNSKGVTMKIVLTAEQIAKISAGATIHQVGLSAEQVEAYEAEQAEQAAADKKAADEKAEKEASDKAAADKLASEGASAGSALIAANAKIDLLSSQLATANAALGAKDIELTNLKASTQSMNETHEGLTAVARTALGRMQVGLGGSDLSEGMDASTLVAEFKRVNEQFITKFKIGAASKAASPEAEEKETDKDPQLVAFRRQAEQLQQNRTAKAK